MSTSKLPETITKERLFEAAQKRFQSWVTMYADPNVSTQHMYENMSCSCYCGCPLDDFPDDVKQDDTIRYQYRDGSCYFIVDGIEVEVFDLRSMRTCSRVNKETYVDVCIPSITYKNDYDNFMYHPIPDAWLYGSTTEDFNEGQPVHKQFICAAQEYIKEHHITKEMQEAD